MAFRNPPNHAAMERVLSNLFCAMLYLYSPAATAQQLRVEVSSPYIAVGPGQLSPPHTAGADFPSQMLLPNSIEISVEQIPQNLTWCLCAAHPLALPAQMELALWPDVSSFPPRTPGTNSSPRPTVLAPYFQPIFSHTGPLYQKNMELYVLQATVLSAQGDHDLPILWQLQEGPCHFF